MTIKITIEVTGPAGTVPFTHTVDLSDDAQGGQIFASTVHGLEKVLSDMHRTYLPTAEEAEQDATKQEGEAQS